MRSTRARQARESHAIITNTPMRTASPSPETAPTRAPSATPSSRDTRRSTTSTRHFCWASSSSSFTTSHGARTRRPSSSTCPCRQTRPSFPLTRRFVSGGLRPCPEPERRRRTPARTSTWQRPGWTCRCCTVAQKRWPNACVRSRAASCWNRCSPHAGRRFPGPTFRSTRWESRLGNAPG